MVNKKIIFLVLNAVLIKKRKNRCIAAEFILTPHNFLRPKQKGTSEY